MNERIFFTRSIRKSRDGFVVFVLDRKTEQSPGSFDEASFSLLYREFADKRKSDTFADRTDHVLQSLEEEMKAHGQDSWSCECKRRSRYSLFL